MSELNQQQPEEEEKEMTEEQLNEMVKQYRTKITDICNLLKEEETVYNDAEKKAEVEKLRDDLKNGLVYYKN